MKHELKTHRALYYILHHYTLVNSWKRLYEVAYVKDYYWSRIFEYFDQD